MKTRSNPKSVAKNKRSHANAKSQRKAARKKNEPRPAKAKTSVQPHPPQPDAAPAASAPQDYKSPWRKPPARLPKHSSYLPVMDAFFYALHPHMSAIEELLEKLSEKDQPDCDQCKSWCKWRWDDLAEFLHGIDEFLQNNGMDPPRCLK